MRKRINNATILVADDEKSIREVLGDILIMEGYTVLYAENGADTLQTVREHQVDVILLDLQMPDMNGLEVTRLLKNDVSLMHIPVVIVTGLNDRKARVEALTNGADDFLLKPPHVAELAARVRSLVKVKAYNDYMRNHQKELEKKVRERTRQLNNAMNELKRASLDTIYRLSRAAEYRDEDTSMHIQRVSNYAASLAKAIGMPDQDVERILYTASMHDIGKIGIPDLVLLKPGKLNEQEWSIMRQHASLGAQILSGSTSELLKTGEVIALAHHEKWDGSGYPAGLKSTEIPLEGRITAVADVFDALTSKRPYKEPFPMETAFNILTGEGGTHFDPELVEGFLSIRPRIIEIHEQYSIEESSTLMKLTGLLTQEKEGDRINT